MDDLLARAEELVREGWLRGSLVDPETGHVCLAGAICQAGIEFNAGREIVPVYALLAEAILLLEGRTAEPEMATIMRWNDAPERTAEDALRALSFARSLASLKSPADPVTTPM